jgi:hypothetical protein
MSTKRKGVPNQSTFILVVHQVQGVIRPNFFDLLDVLFKGHLQLCVSEGDHRVKSWDRPLLEPA